MRTEIRDASRLVVKIGSSSLTHPGGHLDPARIEALAAALAGLHHSGKRIVLVTSGAIAAALGPLGLAKRPRDLETQQGAAAVGQGILIQHYAKAFSAHGVLVAQVLLTAGDLQDGRSYRNALNTVSRLFRLGAIPKPRTMIGKLLNGLMLRSHVRLTVGALPSELVAMSEMEPEFSIRYCCSTEPFCVFFSIPMSESARDGAPFFSLAFEPALTVTVFSFVQSVNPVILVA